MRKLLGICWLMLVMISAAMAVDLNSQKLGVDFQTTRESVYEAIEAAGFVVTAQIQINQMLMRTAGDLDKEKSPFADAETIQFCSARLAWELVEENVAQLSLCPMSLTIYSQFGVPGSVISWRSPGRASPARIRGDDLLRQLVARARLLAGQ